MDTLSITILILFLSVVVILIRYYHTIKTVIVGSQLFQKHVTAGQSSYDLLMNKIAYWMEFKFQAERLGPDDACKAIFVDILNVRAKVYRKTATDVDEASIDHLSKAELFQLFVRAMSDASEMTKRLINEAGIPPLAFQRYKDWTGKKVVFVLKMMEIICYSDQYKTNEQKKQLIFSLFAAALELTMLEADGIIDAFSSDLGEITYKDFTNQPAGTKTKKRSNLSRQLRAELELLKSK